MPKKHVGCAFTREFFPQASRANATHLNGSAELVLALNLDLVERRQDFVYCVVARSRRNQDLGTGCNGEVRPPLQPLSTGHSKQGLREHRRGRTCGA
jgi:hypothetical protein